MTLWRTPYNQMIERVENLVLVYGWIDLICCCESKWSVFILIQLHLGMTIKVTDKREICQWAEL